MSKHTTLEFLHTQVHWAMRRDMSRSLAIAGEIPADLVEVACPTCGTEYFANPLGYIPARRLLDVRRDTRQTARTLLEGECPDHPHRFDVDTEPGTPG